MGLFIVGIAMKRNKGGNATDHTFDWLAGQNVYFECKTQAIVWEIEAENGLSLETKLMAIQEGERYYTNPAE